MEWGNPIVRRICSILKRRNTMRKLYLILAVVGFVVPYSFFGSFLVSSGLNLHLIVSQLFANNISSFFAVDLLISAIVFWVFLYRESRRCRMGNWWIFIVATLTVGPSFALPLFLYFREAAVSEMAFEAKG